MSDKEKRDTRFSKHTFAADVISRQVDGSGLGIADFFPDSNKIPNGIILMTLIESEEGDEYYRYLTMSLGDVIALNDLLTSKLEEIKSLLVQKDETK